MFSNYYSVFILFSRQFKQMYSIMENGCKVNFCKYFCQ